MNVDSNTTDGAQRHRSSNHPWPDNFSSDILSSDRFSSADFRPFFFSSRNFSSVHIFVRAFFRLTNFFVRAFFRLCIFSFVYFFHLYIFSSVHFFFVYGFSLDIFSSEHFFFGYTFFRLFVRAFSSCTCFRQVSGEKWKRLFWDGNDLELSQTNRTVISCTSCNAQCVTFALLTLCEVIYNVTRARFVVR